MSKLWLMIWISLLGLFGYICEIHLKPLNLELIKLVSTALLLLMIVNL